MEEFMNAFSALMQTRGVLIYLIIFFGKFAEVTLSTLRIVLINRGIRIVGSALATLEILLWLVIASNVLTGLKDDPLKGLFYALAFALGNYFGSWLDEKLAFGLSSVQIVVSNMAEATGLAKVIREKGYGITTLNVQGMNENTRYMMLVMIRRKCLHEVLEIISEYSKSAVVTVSDVKVQKGGYLRNSPTRHLHSGMKDAKWPNANAPVVANEVPSVQEQPTAQPDIPQSAENKPKKEIIMTYRIAIEGMGCEHCVSAVTKALEDIGAVAKEVTIGSAVAEFAGDKSAIKAAIEDAGFDVISIDEA